MVGRTIDWGDGTTSNTEKSHTYENYGSYTVKVPAISGALSRVLFDSAMVQYYGKPVKAIRCNQDVTDLDYFEKMGLAVDVVLNKAFAVGSDKTSICCGKLYHMLNNSSYIYKNGIEYVSVNKNYTGNVVAVLPNQENIKSTKIKNIYMPSSATTIESNSFYSCISLKSINTDNITSIKNSAFQNCYSLQSINIPNGVTSIQHYTFQDCSLLQSINIPDGVTSIGNSAFEGCSSLQSITLPSSITSIGNYVFSGCFNIRYAKINTILLQSLMLFMMFGLQQPTGLHLLLKSKKRQNTLISKEDNYAYSRTN